jgi:uncharacterized integral membrane protein (TIGR00698 family)
MIVPLDIDAISLKILRDLRMNASLRAYAEVVSRPYGGSRSDPTWYPGIAFTCGTLLVVLGAPSWAALTSGMMLAVLSGQSPHVAVKRWTSHALQIGVVALGAGMNLAVVLRVGTSGAAITALTLLAALALARVLGRWLGVLGNTSLLIGVGTAICGGSAIAALSSVVEPDDHELSVSLGVVFTLNAVGLVLLPALGHAMGLSELVFGRWAALAIHDTSSVVGAGLAYGPQALQIATTTKLARALWIVPVTLVIAMLRTFRGTTMSFGQLRSVKWPWFILVFVVVAAAFTWLPHLNWLSMPIVAFGQRTLVLALYLIGLSLSRKALSRVGFLPLMHGVILWIIVGVVSLGLVKLQAGASP